MVSSPPESSPQNKNYDAEQLEFQETVDDEYTSNDARFADKTLQEKKNLMIEHEMNRQGMGKYQRWIWFLCGLGYFLDLLWAQAIGLILPPMQQEFGFDESASANLFSTWAAGLCVGAVTFGYVVDVIGRYWAFNLTVFISSLFGMALGGANNYQTAMGLAFFNGLGIGGNIPIDTTIALEFLPNARRDLLPLLSIFQPLGVVVTTLLAYGYIPRFNCVEDGVIKSCATETGIEPPDCLPACSKVPTGQDCCRKSDNMGWRFLLYTVGSISMAVFLIRFALFAFQESPKFLIQQKKDHLAINTVTYIGEYNETPTKLTLQRFQELDRIEAAKNPAGPNAEPPGTMSFWQYFTGALTAFWGWVKRVGQLFRPLWIDRRPSLVIIVLFIYAFDFWGFSIVGALFPKILLGKNSALGLSTRQTYRDYLIIYPPGIVGVLCGVAAYHVPWHGRRVGMLAAAAGYCAALFAFANVTKREAYIGVNVLEYFCQSMFNSILYAWTPEAFPTNIRGTASGLASSVGRAFSIFMPLAAAKLLDKADGNGAIYLAASGVGAMIICVAMLPNGVFDKNAHLGK